MITISIESALELDNIISGVFSPLKTFNDEKNYHSIIEEMKTTSGDIWPIPIILPMAEPEYKSYELCYDNIKIAEIKVDNIFELNPEKEASAVYGTISLKHHGVNKIFQREKYAVSGEIVPISQFRQKEYESYYKSPTETKAIFSKWKKIVGFQTRNPIHRAHEYVTKSSLESVDALFINPLAGPQKEGDIPAGIRLKCYESLIENYFNPNYVVLSIYPSPMYYAGPREAVLHAIVRRNYGCTHFIVGRDHAGMGNFYGPYDAQKLVDQLNLGIDIIKFDIVSYDRITKSMVSSKTMPKKTDLFEISGTKLRSMLESGEEIPEGISRPEVLEILKDYYAGKR